MHPLVKAALGGLLGGLVGAAIWAGIAYASHREVGIVAWVVGGLVGFGVRLAAGENDGPKFGVLAAGVALLAIVVGKFVAVSLIVSDLKVEGGLQVTDQDMIVTLADEVVKDRQARGKRVNFPPGMTLEKAGKQADYPPDVWQEASKKWTALGPAEQQRKIAERKKETEKFVGELKGELRKVGFKESFGPFDILWFILATVTAFRLGSGAISSE